MKEEQILKILKKYGFYSLNRAPYIYQEQNRYGVYFVWPTKYYGNLERVLFFDDEESLEDEIYKYWWFLNHKKELDIEILFDNYEVLSPKVTYFFKNTELTSFIMKNFNAEEKNIIDEEEVLKKKQLLRTSNILILLLNEKLRVQNETYLKVLDLQEKLKNLTIIFKKKVNLYNKSNEEISENFELLRDDADQSNSFIQSLQEELSFLDSLLGIKNFINKLISYLKNTDTNEIHLQNNYLLNRFPIEIEIINKKIGILDEALKGKKKAFKTKKNVELFLKEIDSNSSCVSMPKVNVYIEQEKNKVLEKYDTCKMIDDSDLGDHLLTFENVSFEIPQKIEESLQVATNPELLFTELKSVYEKLNKEEQAACHVSASFLGECLNILMEIPSVKELNVSEIINQLVLKKQIERFNVAFKYLDHYLNVKIRLNYFSILKTDSFEAFIDSLVNTIQILNQITIKLNRSFIGFYDDKGKNIIPIYLKNICYLEKELFYIVHFNANISIYYSPVQIVKPLDVLEVSELEVKENEMLFLLQQKVKIDTNEKKVFVVKYKKDKIMKKEDFVAIINMNEQNKCVYYEDVVSSLESER